MPARSGHVRFDVADEQSLGELVLILEVIEEPALGDVDGGDQFLNRRGREAFLEHSGLCHVENAPFGVAALARLLHVSRSPAGTGDCTTGTLKAPRTAVRDAPANAATLISRQF